MFPLGWNKTEIMYSLIDGIQKIIIEMNLIGVPLGPSLMTL